MNEHQKKLCAYGHSVYPNGQFQGHKNLRAIRQAVADGYLKVIKTVPHDGFGSIKDYDFSNAESTTTYEECIRVELTVDGTIVLLIQDGENMHGQPIADRVTFHLEGEWWRLYAKQVSTHFDAMCMQMLTQQEEEARLARAKTIGVHLLKVFDKGTKNV